MQTLSVAIITFNEEQNIERCIKSVIEIADEIIVVDSNSTDMTLAICNRLGAKVFAHPFEGYSAQKNIASNYCNCDLIFSLDADEMPDCELIEEVKRIKQLGKYDCYSINRKTFINEKWVSSCGWYPDNLIRIWRKDYAKWEGEIVHENCIPIKNASITQLEGHLLHFSFKNIADQIARLNKYSSLSAQKKFMAGKKSAIWKLIVYPRVRFFRDFILKKGFMDGFYGYVVARNNAFETYLKYAKLLEFRTHDK